MNLRRNPGRPSGTRGRPLSGCSILLIVASSLSAPSGCGSGTLGLATSGGSSSGGGTNLPTAINGLTLTSTKSSPAEIQFALADAESDPVDLEIRYFVPQSGEARRATLVEDPNRGIDADLQRLSTSPQTPDQLGSLHTKLWDFARDLPAGTAFTRGVRLELETTRSDLGTSAGIPVSLSDLSVGNDPPAIAQANLPAPPGEESVGIVDIDLLVIDSSNDLVRIVVEYDVLGDEPDVGFRRALPAGTPPGDPVPEFALEGVRASESGSRVLFFWDVVGQTGASEFDVQLRFTAEDAADRGSSFVTVPFRVDNNRRPTLTLDGTGFSTNPDDGRGIPLPLTVFDGDEFPPEAGDEIRVVMQWRREPETYPDLPIDDVDAIEELLRDPVRREELRIATEIPLIRTVDVIPVNPSRLRIPRLAKDLSQFVSIDPSRGTPRMTGEIEILRDPVPLPLRDGWKDAKAVGLVCPVAALPYSRGRKALVLEDLGEAYRLRALELREGTQLAILAQGPGRPTALSLEPQGDAILVALYSSSEGWSVVRIPVTNPPTTQQAELLIRQNQASIRVDGNGDRGSEGPTTPIRGLASLGKGSSAATTGDSLLRLTYPPAGSAPFAGVVATGLQNPAGLAVDPSHPNRVYVAEQLADRILNLDLATHERSLVETSGLSLRRPESIAVEVAGRGLYVIVDEDDDDGTKELVRVDVGAITESDGNPSVRIFPPVGASGYSGDLGHVHTGEDGVVLLALRSASDLALGGGIEERTTLSRRSEDYDPATQTVVLDPPLVSLPRAGQSARITQTATRISASPFGTTRNYVWDSRDVGEATTVFLRAIPFDREVGTIGDTAIPRRPKSIRSARPAPDSVRSIETIDPQDVTVADIDGDGDLDLATVISQTGVLAAFFQIAPRVFSDALILRDGSRPYFPLRVGAGDLNGDGLIDLYTGNFVDVDRDYSRPITVFFQTEPGVFDPNVLSLGNPDLSARDGISPRKAISADLDGDGRTDLIGCNRVLDNLQIFYQEPDGSFGLPDLLGRTTFNENPEDVLAVDIDADGDLDLITANAADDNLSIFFQSQPRTFSLPPTRVFTQIDGRIQPRTPRALAAGDLDGDGDLDLAVGGQRVLGSASIHVFFQTDRGVFPRTSVELGFDTTTTLWSISIGDTDGDGDNDLVTSNDMNPGQVAIFPQTAPGTFDPDPIILFENSSASSIASEVADLDGDGIQDVIAAERSRGFVIFYGEKPAINEAPVPLADGQKEATPRSGCTGDFDLDGDLDLAIANFDGDNLTVYLQASPRVLDDNPRIIGTGTIDGPQAILAADLDGDGDLDLATANREGENIALFFQTGPGNFASPPVILGNPQQTGSPRSLTAGDLDGDGDLDLVSANATSNHLTVFFQEGAGEFPGPPLIVGSAQTSRTPVSVLAEDMNRDGRLDLISANRSGDNLTLFLQKQDGQFEAEPIRLGIPSTIGDPQSLAAADLDGDGRKDLVVGSFDRDNVSVFFQRGEGRFRHSPITPIGSIPDPRSLAIADLDADGDLDLLVASEAGDRLHQIDQVAPGVFAQEPKIFGGPGMTESPNTVLAADIDGDRDVDLVSIQLQGPSPTIFYGGE